MDGPAKRHHLSIKPTPPNYTVKEQSREKEKPERNTHISVILKGLALNLILFHGGFVVPWEQLRRKTCRPLATNQSSAGWPEASRMEEDVGSDGEAGRASQSQSCVILTTQTRCLMTGNNKTHTAKVNALKTRALCYYLPQKNSELQWDWTNNSYQREWEEKQKKWERCKNTRSWRLTAR